MAKYRKKPIVIDAWQLTKENVETTLPEWLNLDEVSIFDGKELFAEIKTLEGVMRADEGDYIIKGVKGEFYPCKSDIFEQTYEVVALWSCDPDFDIAILADLYKEHNLILPWKFSEPKSVRTVRMLTQLAGMEIPTQEADHNALNDCIRQAKEVSYFIAKLQHDGA